MAYKLTERLVRLRGKRQTIITVFALAFSTLTLLIVHASAASSQILYVKPSGNDASSNTCLVASNPCLTIDNAYHKASSGDTVMLLPGTYSAQLITRDSTKVSCCVLIQPQDAANTTLGGLSFGRTPSEGNQPGGNYISLVGNGMKVGSLEFKKADNVTVDNVHASLTYFYGASNITVRNTEFRGYDQVPPDSLCGTDQINHPEIGLWVNSQTGESVTNSHIKFLNDWFHDVMRPPSACKNMGSNIQEIHSDCLQIEDADDIEIAANRFGPRCDVNGLFMDPGSAINNVDIYNNVFEPTTDAGGTGSGAYGLSVGNPQQSNATLSNIKIRFNTLDGWATVGGGGAGTRCTGTCVYGGNVGNGSCPSISGKQWAVIFKNVGTNWASCDGIDLQTTTTAVKWKDPSSADYHLLSGSAAIGAIPYNTYCPATDKDGIARPKSGFCDAGAYQFAPGATTASADFNGDGKVDVLDLSILVGNWRKAGTSYKGDLNADGNIDNNDFSAFKLAYKS